jgi:hypothetical protein
MPLSGGRALASRPRNRQIAAVTCNSKIRPNDDDNRCHELAIQEEKTALAPTRGS